MTNNYILGLGYNSEDKSLHGYLGGIDTPFASEKYNSTLNDDNGYCELDNGLIMQYGSVPVDDTKKILYEEHNKFTITFSKEFPHKLFSVSVTLEMHGAQPAGNNVPYVYEQNKKGAWGIIDEGYGTKYAHINQQFGAKVHYIAIGY